MSSSYVWTAVWLSVFANVMSALSELCTMWSMLHAMMLFCTPGR